MPPEQLADLKPQLPAEVMGERGDIARRDPLLQRPGDPERHRVAVSDVAKGGMADMRAEIVPPAGAARDPLHDRSDRTRSDHQFQSATLVLNLPFWLFLNWTQPLRCLAVVQRGFSIRQSRRVLEVGTSRLVELGSGALDVDGIREQVDGRQRHRLRRHHHSLGPD